MHSANSPQFGLTVFSPFRDIVSNKCSIPLWWRLSTCSYLTTAWMPSWRPIFSNMWIFASSFSPDVNGNLVPVPKFWYLVFWVLGLRLHDDWQILLKQIFQHEYRWKLALQCQSFMSAIHFALLGVVMVVVIVIFITAYSTKCHHSSPLKTFRQKWMIKLKPGT